MIKWLSKLFPKKIVSVVTTFMGNKLFPKLFPKIIMGNKLFPKLFPKKINYWEINYFPRLLSKCVK